MSITLTPIDDAIVPAKFALVGPREIWDYVMARQEYRSFNVKSNTLPKIGRTGGLHNRSYFDNTESSLAGSIESVEHEHVSEVDSMFDEDQGFEEVQLSPEKEPKDGQKFKLPNTLLREPLD